MNDKRNKMAGWSKFRKFSMKNVLWKIIFASKLTESIGNKSFVKKCFVLDADATKRYVFIIITFKKIACCLFFYGNSKYLLTKDNLSV